MAVQFLKKSQIRHVATSLALLASFTTDSGIAAPSELLDEHSAVVQRISPLPLSELPTIDPFALYGERAFYDVFRKGQKVGEHRVHFSRDGERLSVTANFTLEIPFLFFTAYRFQYNSTEVWDGNELVALTAVVDDNGEIAQTSAELKESLFKIYGPRGPAVLSSWIFPTNHWHRGQVNAPVILNTLTGRVSHVETLRKGIDTVVTPAGEIQAEHFVYTGDLRDTEVWYDAEGRWIKMRFKAKGDAVLEYVCYQCGLESEAFDLGLSGSRE